MYIAAVYSALACFEIEVPDDATEGEFDELANEWLTEHFCEVAEAIDDAEIGLEEVWA